MISRRLILTAALGFIFCGRAAAGAAVLEFQGQLQDAAGRGLSGSYLLDFVLWDSPVGGTELWRESIYVQSEKGIYRAQLGRVKAIPSDGLKGTYRIEAVPPAGTGWIARSLGSRTQAGAPPETARPAPIEAARPAPAPPIEIIETSTPAPVPPAPAPEASRTEGELERLRRELESTRSELDLRKTQPTALPAVYQVRPGDTLRSVAEKLYGNPERWTDLYQANDDRVLRGGELTPGQRLIVPRGGKVQ